MRSETSEAISLQFLVENRQAFERLLEKALSLEQRGLMLESAVTAQAAAEFAWRNHSGLFASEQIEALGARLAAFVKQKTAVRSAGTERQAGQHKGRRVLHVLTHAVTTGGHTRLAWRWAQQDRRSEHSFVLIRQGRYQVPQALVDMMEQGYSLWRLDTAGSLFEWASALRMHALAAEVVVLHTHPSDIVPLLALTNIGIPVVIVNHADHVFWLGGSLAWAVAQIRDSGLNLSTARRGIPPERSGVVPIPLQSVVRQVTRSQAKQELGLPQDAPLLLSIASAYKFSAIGDLDFLRISANVLERHQKAIVVVVGPQPEGLWLKWMQRFPGRALALGTRTDLAMFHQAADVYLDSLPFASLTSALETVLYGVPLVSFRPVAGADVLFTDDPALISTQFRTDSEMEYMQSISKLLQEPDWRYSLGDQLGTALRESRSEMVWQQQVESIYERAQSLGEPTAGSFRSGGPYNTPEMIDVWLERFLRISRFGNGLSGAWREHVRLLPTMARIQKWFDPQVDLPHQFLLPERFALRLERRLRGEY